MPLLPFKTLTGDKAATTPCLPPSEAGGQEQLAPAVRQQNPGETWGQGAWTTPASSPLHLLSTALAHSPSHPGDAAKEENRSNEGETQSAVTTTFTNVHK